MIGHFQRLLKWYRRNPKAQYAAAFVILLAAVGIVFRPAWKQFRAVQRLEAKGYRIGFESVSGNWATPRAGSNWLDRLWIQYQKATCSVTGIDLSNQPLEFADFDALANLKLGSDVGLLFDQSQLNNRHMVRLKKFPTVTKLSLRRTRLRDVGMVHLRELKKLQWLDLGSTRITDAGIDEILGMKELEVLWLENTDVTIAGLMKLKSLPKLREVHHYECRYNLALLKAMKPDCQFD